MDVNIVSVAGFSELRLQEYENAGDDRYEDMFQLLVSLN